MILDKWWSLALATILLGVLTSSCVGPKGASVEEKRASARAMRDEALAALYADDPDLKKKVEESAGYAVFSNLSVHPGLLSFASGYGMVTNNRTGKETHSRWSRLTLGPGLAVKGLYGLVVIRDANLLEEFEEGRWTLLGQAEASFVFGDFGGSLEKGWLFRRGITGHYVTHTGVALELELIGIGRVWNDAKLNRADSP